MDHTTFLALDALARLAMANAQSQGERNEIFWAFDHSTRAGQAKRYVHDLLVSQMLVFMTASAHERPGFGDYVTSLAFPDGSVRRDEIVSCLRACWADAERALEANPALYVSGANWRWLGSYLESETDGRMPRERT